MKINGNIFNNVIGEMLEGTGIDIDRQDVLKTAFLNYVFAGHDTDDIQAIIDKPKFKKIKKYLDEGELIILKDGTQLKGYSATTVEAIIKEITNAEKFPKIETTANDYKTRMFAKDKVNMNIPKLPIMAVSESDYNVEDLFEATPPIIAGQEKSTGEYKYIHCTLFIDYEAIGRDIPRVTKFTNFDYEVYSAIASLYEKGFADITARMIYNEMGKNGNPNKDDKKKILSSVFRLSIAKLIIDNSEETDYLNYNYPRHYRETHSMLDADMKWGVEYNGNVVKDAIHVKEEPWLMAWAKERRQVTVIPTSMLQIPLSNTEFNLELRNAIIHQIVWKESSNKITFDYLYKATGATDRRIKQRVRERSAEILKYYECEGIKDVKCEVETDGIIFKKSKKKSKKNKVS